MSGIRPLIETAVAQAIAEHPKYFTEVGLDNNRACTAIVRKVWAAMRGDGADKSSDAESTEPKTLVPAVPQPMTVPHESREARAFGNLRKLAGAQPQFRSAAGVFINAEANNAAVFAFADLPPENEWAYLTERKNLGAWLQFFIETLPGVARRPIIDRNAVIRMPWPWPPSKDGKTYTTESEQVA